MDRLIEGGRNQRSRQLSLVVRWLLSDPISKNTSRYKRLSRPPTHATLASSVEISSHSLVVSTPTARIHVLFPNTGSQLKSRISVDEYKETWRTDWGRRAGCRRCGAKDYDACNRLSRSSVILNFFFPYAMLFYVVGASYHRRFVLL